MARFLIAIDKVLKHEAGWVNHPDDPGGETFRGISRVYWPRWSGWVDIDRHKSTGGPGWVKRVDADERILGQVYEFYRRNFWDHVRGDDIPDEGQPVADELLDAAVLPGVFPASKFLQVGLNVLNRGGRLYADVVEDGVVGPRTICTLERFLANDSPHDLVRIQRALRAGYFLDRVRESETKEAFVRGWLRRVMA
jgi:lysozyme family protein